MEKGKQMTNMAVCKLLMSNCQKAMGAMEVVQNWGWSIKGMFGNWRWKHGKTWPGCTQEPG